MFEKLLKCLGWMDDAGTRHLDGLVLARAYPKPEHLRKLAEEGLGLVINLHQRPHPPLLLTELGLRELHLPVPDFTAPSLAQLRQGVEAVLANRPEAGKFVLIHCGAGLGRTGTLLACLYVAQGLELETAIERVRAERKGTIETKGQLDVIRAFAETFRSTG